MIRKVWLEVEEGTRIAAVQIAVNRTRSILTALGVAIGIIAVTLMGTAISGIDTGFNRSMSGFGDDVLYIEQWPWTTLDDYWQFRNRPDIKLSGADRLNRMIQANTSSLLDLSGAAPASDPTVTSGKKLGCICSSIGVTKQYAQIPTKDSLK